jgi:hypothetical protein
MATVQGDAGILEPMSDLHYAMSEMGRTSLPACAMSAIRTIAEMRDHANMAASS